MDPDRNMAKPFYKSKTLQVMLLQIIIGVATWAMGNIETGAALTLTGLVGTILRVITQEPIDLK